MSELLRVAVIGVGHLGQHHARIFAELPNVDLVGVVDVNKVRANEIAHRCGTKAVKNYQDLNKEKVDAVSVVVPTTLHYSVGKFFLEKGVHTFIEKPICSSTEQARELIELADKSKVVLQVGHIERFNSAVIKLNELLKEPRFIESQRLSTFDPRIKDVGVVLDLMIHDIDIILQVVKSEVDKIEALGLAVLTDFEDIANARITFKNGCFANLTASRISKNKLRKLRLFQNDAYFSLDYAKPELEVYRRVAVNGVLMIDEEKIFFPSVEPLKEEIKSFVNSIYKGIPPVVPGEHGHDALEVAQEILKQISKQKIT